MIVKQAGPGKLTVTDAKGDVAKVTIADVMQSNGVIHVIDTVLLPYVSLASSLSPPAGERDFTSAFERFAPAVTRK